MPGFAASTKGPVGRGSYSFARHETFHLRDGWLHKGLAAVQTDAQALYKEGAHHALGLGINMLQALIYWLQATSLVTLESTGAKAKLPMRVTEIGDIVTRYDPYFEDVGTLWLLHVELASNQRLATFWHWAFSEFPQREFDETRLVQGMERWLGGHGYTGLATSSLSRTSVEC